MKSSKKSDSEVCLIRLKSALKYLELARVSRSLAYSATPYVMSAELLIQEAIKQQEKYNV